MLKVLKYMVKLRNLPVVLLILGGGVFVAFKTLGVGGNPPSKDETILHNIGEYLEELHYSPKPINDSFSLEVFKKYLGEVDADKNIFFQSDVDQLRSRYGSEIDDEILGKPIVFVPAVNVLYKKRLAETEQIYKSILARPFDFSQEEDYDQNFDKLGYPKNEADRKEAWRKQLKYLTLERYADMLENQETNKNTPGYVVRTDAQIEKDARQKTLKVMDRLYDRLKVKMSDDDRFNMFVETIVQTMDPHTDYFPPVEKRYFDEQMSGRFFGIGASLKEEDGNIKITTLVTGSPAWKSGKVGVNDVILKVGEGNAEPIDLSGYSVEDAIKVIRGAKGSEVRLTLKKPDGTTHVVSLIREEIVQDELTFARSFIVNSPKGKIGYIYLPEFYADFDNPKGNRCSIDVAKEIMKLKAEKVDGIVLDLRNNGGGSLADVVQMAGLFVEQGPIVQVRSRDEKPQVYPDRDKTVLWDGPFAVMVNELSASASEIFAAAIQDYHRGVIIGSSSTYGKGTVQRPIGLDKALGLDPTNSELGTIKLTLQKFYRISGGSTQLRGVASDIVLPDIYPDIYEYMKIREKDNPDALPWDEIPKADYTPWKYAYDINYIKGLSDQRLRHDSALNQVQADAEWLSKTEDKVFSLNLKKYQQEQKEIKAKVREIEDLSKLRAADQLNILSLPEDAHKYDDDKNKAIRNQAWLKEKRSDLWLGETVNVLDDMIAQKSIVYNK
ncbi:MAG TPA: carboxy terminal-processing peptidase [Puia sp.]|jgi:carboxyl-terminal processing protease|nr:carboxy terminal-processing peptidase [Puia sp.]